MRCAGLVLLMFLAGGVARADVGQDLMDALGPGYGFEGGMLSVEIYPDAKVWLNGRRLPTHDDDASIRIQPGDVLITASPEKWHEAGQPTTLPAGDIYCYRFDRLDATRAVFTLTTFDEVETTISSTTKSYRLGRRRTTAEFTIDLTQPHVLMVDYGLNHVELEAGLPKRSKPLR